MSNILSGHENPPQGINTNKTETMSSNACQPAERKVCTKENPYPKGEVGMWSHPDAIEIEEDYGKGGGVADGDYIRYECPNCNLKFWVELPN